MINLQKPEIKFKSKQKTIILGNLGPNINITTTLPMFAKKADRALTSPMYAPQLPSRSNVDYTDHERAERGKKKLKVVKMLAT